MLTLSPVRFFLSVTALFVAIGAPPLSAEVITKTGRFNGAQVSYRVILPDGYDASKEYPGILAFPGGGQGLGLVDGMIAQNLREQSESRGYITVVPAAPTQGLFFQGGDVIFPAFLDTILRDYKIRGGKFHVMGVSNGGISAFHIAAEHPAYFWTVTGLPGYLRSPETRMGNLKGLCIHMYVGERDAAWVQTMQSEWKIFQAAGLGTSFSIEPGQGHVMGTLQGRGAARLFDNLEAEPTGCAD